MLSGRIYILYQSSLMPFLKPNVMCTSNSDCKTVRLLDSDEHDLLARQLKDMGLNPYLKNWKLSFIKGAISELWVVTSSKIDSC